MTHNEIELKKPPHSREAEQSVLGGLLINNSVWEYVAEIITPDDFYFKDNRFIFKAIQQKLDANDACDVVILSEYFEKSNNSGDV
ncbi:MAG: replicative DNA helicase, partial [gamma proteobacterium symbiont of Bathyaustriella thionipta]|nr:replicative DNA helicase [gamma proteobacterium symbiont of Bathyaustriella thionipta]